MRKVLGAMLGAFVSLGCVLAIDPPANIQSFISASPPSAPPGAQLLPIRAMSMQVSAGSQIAQAQFRTDPRTPQAGQLVYQAQSTQGPPDATQPVYPIVPSVQIATNPELIYSEQDFSSPFWFNADYLLWWVKGAPVSVPLVTTGDPNVGFPLTNSAGGIGQAGTRVLYGNSTAGFNALSGMRFTLGGWIGRDRIWGIEASGFVTQRQSNQFIASSDANGNPPLYFPAFNVSANEERGLPISDPLRLFAGDVTVRNTIQFGGYEINALYAATRRNGFNATVLAGFRYMQLNEQLQIHNLTTDLLFSNITVSDDLFQTRNEFYGGQVGARLGWNRERLSLQLTGKIALGGTRQTTTIEGTTTQTELPGGFAPTPGTFNSGIYAQASNIGQRSTTAFSVIPSLDVKLGYQITPRLRGTVGYDFMYWSNVVRPGNLLDHNVNQTQSPVFGSGTLVGPAVPAPQSANSGFLAHGVSFGLQLSY